MTKLFRNKPAADRKSVQYEIRMTTSEAESVQNAAKIRCLSVAEYMLKASLGRRADVRFDAEIVLVIREIVQVIRQLHSQFVMQRIVPPSDLLELLLDESILAMQRISK